MEYICSQCGEHMTVPEGQKVCQCTACSAVFVLPNQFDKKENIYRLAAEARFNWNFDLAETYYSRILKIDGTEVEANWGYLLSHYGIEISNNPRTYGRIYFHRMENTSFMEDPAYAKMIEYCPQESLYYYEGMARRIEEKHRRLLAIARQVKAAELYIDCVAPAGTQDCLMAVQIGQALENEGYRVFLPCVMLANTDPEEQNLYEIAMAERAEAMLVVQTPETDNQNERFRIVWKRFLAYRAKDAGKKLLSVFRGILPEQMPMELQPLQAIDCGGNDFAATVTAEINRMFGRQSKSSDVTRRVLEELRTGEEALENKEWAKAEEAFSNVIGLDAEESRGHFGRFRARTEDLTVPAEQIADDDYRIALACAQKQQRREYENKATALMKEPCIQAVMDATGDFGNWKAEESDAVKAALERAELYVPPADPFHIRVAKYHRYCATEKEAAALEDAYRREDAVQQPLFNERIKAVNDVVGTQLGKGKILTTGKTGTKFAVIAQILMVGVYMLLVWLSQSPSLFAGWRFVLLRICEHAGMVLVLFALAWTTIGSLLHGDATILMPIIVIGTIVIMRIVEHFIMGLIVPLYFCLMFVPIAVLIVIRVRMILESNSVRKGVERRKKAVIRVRELNTELREAYQQDMKDLFARHNVPDHRIPDYPSSDTEVNEAAPVGSKTSGLVLAVVLPIVLFLAATVATNLFMAGGWKNITDISVSDDHVVGLREDGTVVSNGNNLSGQTKVGAWKDVVKVEAGSDFTVGLRSDGTCLVATKIVDGVKDAENWTDIIDIEVSNKHILGLRRDGTVVAAGTNSYNEMEVGDYANVVQILAVRSSDGPLSFIVTEDGSTDVTAPDDQWTSIQTWLRNHTGPEGEYTVKEIYGTKESVLCRCADGKMFGIGSNENGQLEGSELWDSTHVVDAFASGMCLGVTDDGHVLYAGNNMAQEKAAAEITDAVAVTHGHSEHALVLKKDGTVTTVGTNDMGQCDVSSWKNIRAVDSETGISYGICEDGSVVAAGDTRWGMTYVHAKNPLELFKFWIDVWQWL